MKAGKNLFMLPLILENASVMLQNYYPYPRKLLAQISLVILLLERRYTKIWLKSIQI